jgi:hypothetical protein
VILVEVIVAGLLLSLLAGGSFRALQEERLLAEWVLLALLPLQMLWPAIAGILGLNCAWSRVIWLLLMAVLGAVLLVNAPRRWTLAIAGLGISLNILVIGINGGMPVSFSAAQSLGAERADLDELVGRQCLYVALDDSTLLSALGDVLPVPGPRWHQALISVGDLLLALGLSGWLFVAARGRLRRA